MPDSPEVHPEYVLIFRALTARGIRFCSLRDDLDRRARFDGSRDPATAVGHRPWLRPDSRTGTATITATITTGGDATATVDVQVGESEETKPTLLLFAEPESINLSETSTISVQARNADDSNFGSGGRVELHTSLGTLDDDSLVTDADGQAETTLRPSGEIGTATVTGTLESSDEVTVEVQFGATAETKPTLLLTASPTNIGFDQSTTISILVRNPDGTSFTGSGTARVRTSLGTLSEENVTVTEGEGEAILTNEDGAAGTATVTITFEASDETTLDITFEAATLTISASPDNIKPDRDLDRVDPGPQPDGSTFPTVPPSRLRSTLGSLSTQSPEVSGGEASATLTTDGEIGTATVTASLGASESVTVDVELGEQAEDRPTPRAER